MGWSTQQYVALEDERTRPVRDLLSAAARMMPSATALMERLTVGGVLAVQMPDNLEEPSHVLMREIAGDGPWAERLADVSERTTYHHALRGGAGAIVEWFKGSGLRPYLAPLGRAERAEFLARYEAAVACAYPAMPDGTVLLPFPRLFLIASRG